MDTKRVISVSKHATVLEAVNTMVEGRVGAAPVLEHERLLGVVSERDIVARVVFKRLDPTTTPITEVMTAPVATVREDADRSTILRLMVEHRVHYLPVVDDQGRVLEMLSLRHLLRAEVQDLRQTMWALAADTMVAVCGG